MLHQREIFFGETVNRWDVWPTGPLMEQLVLTGMPSLTQMFNHPLLSGSAAAANFLFSIPAALV